MSGLVGEGGADFFEETGAFCGSGSGNGSGAVVVDVEGVGGVQAEGLDEGDEGEVDGDAGVDELFGLAAEVVGGDFGGPFGFGG